MEPASAIVPLKSKSIISLVNADLITLSDVPQLRSFKSNNTTVGILK